MSILKNEIQICRTTIAAPRDKRLPKNIFSRNLPIRLLLQHPASTLLFDADRPLLVQADTTCIEDGSGQHCVCNGRETCRVVICRLRLHSVDAPCSVDKLLDRNITITALAVKMTTLRWGIFHAEDARIFVRSGQTYRWNALERIRPRFSNVVDCNIVSAMSLIDINIALEPKIAVQ